MKIILLKKKKMIKTVEMIKPSYEGMSGRGTMLSNNPINQSTVNNNTLLDNFENN